ncbi:DUF5018 domain-containing protein [Mangrovivirga cuniculi]|uniref:DUF5018 domain-containing protein n=1 Tax=Mangrovivirga cuniculi TaxID=2715131 RepID=A0A4D7JQ33_9BACT|nr:DUF5018 domain-containing protein [Mangrovivirga cuniculi]QCK16757.1 hypothetical protein DCC35_19475 [Mangrovivirga cuniculi]
MNISIALRNVLTLCIAGTFLFSCDDEREFNEGPFESKRTDITSFVFEDLEPAIEGNINEMEHLVTATVPFESDLTQLSPTIEISERATISPPSGTPVDFTDTASYFVTAENGDVQEWKVALSLADPEEKPKLVLSSPLWNLSPAGSGVPDFFTVDGERGLAYGNDHLYVTNNNDKILILDPSNGSALGQLDMTGVEGGQPKIADVEVSADGTILACNTVEWTSDEGGAPTTFKIYKWNNETSTPEVWLSYTNTEYRMGDSFSVIGDINGDAVILTAYGRKFLNPTGRGALVFKWTVSNGVLNEEPELITVGGVPSLTKFGSRPHANMLNVDSEFLYVNANDIDFTKATLDGTFVARIPNTGRSLYDGFNSYFEIFEFAEKTVLATVFPRSSVESRLLIIDITEGIENVTTEEVILSQSFMSGEIANVNASGAVTINIVNSNKVEVYCLITNQALAKFELSTELQ